MPHHRHSPLDRAFTAFFRFLTRHSIAALVIGAVLVGLGLFGLTRLKTDFRPNSIFNDFGEEVAVRDRMLEVFGDTDDQLFIMLRAENVFAPEFLDLIHNLTESTRDLPNFEDVISLTSASYFQSSGEEGFEVQQLLGPPPHTPEQIEAGRKRFLASDFFVGTLVNPEATVTSVVITFEDGHEDDAERRAQRKAVEQRVARFLPSPLVAEYHLTGIPMVQAEYLEIAVRDQFYFISLVGVLFMFILVFLFRNVLGVLAPCLAVGLSVFATLAGMGFLGLPMTMISTATPTIISVYGIADAIHILLRYREELGRGHGKQDAILITMVSMAKACFLTSFTTFVGFLSLLTAENSLVKNFGLVTGSGVMIAFVVSILLLPPLMHLFPAMKSHSRAWDESHQDWISTLLHRVADWLPKVKWAVLAATVGLIALSTWGSTKVVKETFLLEELAKNNPVTLAYRFSQKYLTGLLDFEVAIEVAEEDGVLNPQVLQSIEAIERWMEEQPEISGATSLATFMRGMNRAFHNDDPAYDRVPESRELAAQYRLLYDISNEGTDLLRPVVNSTGTMARVVGMRYDIGAGGFGRLHQRFEQWRAANLPPELSVRVYGVSLLVTTSIQHIVQDLATSLISAFFIISVTLAISFRSVWLGVLSMVPNMLPLLCTMGFMGASGITLRTATVIIFSISLGIAVDDTIHFLARYMEELKRTGNAAEATRETMLTVGRAMLFTSALLMGGFTVLLTSDFRALFHFGLLTTLCVFVAITADLTVTPVLMLVLKPGERRGK